MEDNQIPYYFLIQKQNQEYYFAAEEHDEEHYLLADKFQMLYPTNLNRLGVPGHNASYICNVINTWRTTKFLIIIF